MESLSELCRVTVVRLELEDPILLEGIKYCRAALVGHDARLDRWLETRGCLHQAASPDQLADLLAASCGYLEKQWF